MTTPKREVGELVMSLKVVEAPGEFDRSVLVARIGHARAAWKAAAHFAPSNEDAANVGLVLDALLGVVQQRNADGLALLDKAARAVFALNPNHGVMPDTPGRVRWRPAWAETFPRREGRSEAARHIAECMDRALNSTKPKFSASRLAGTFVALVAYTEPIAGELKRAGKIGAGRPAVTKESLLRIREAVEDALRTRAQIVVSG